MMPLDHHDNTIEANKTRIARAGFIQRVIEAMEMHQTDPKVLYIACAALRNMTSQHADNRRAVMKLGGIDAVLRCMDAFPKDGGIAYWGLAVLVNLSRDAGALDILANKREVTAAMDQVAETFPKTTEAYSALLELKDRIAQAKRR